MHPLSCGSPGENRPCRRSTALFHAVHPGCRRCEAVGRRENRRRRRCTEDFRRKIGCAGNDFSVFARDDALCSACSLDERSGNGPCSACGPDGRLKISYAGPAGPLTAAEISRAATAWPISAMEICCAPPARPIFVVLNDYAAANLSTKSRLRSRCQAAKAPSRMEKARQGVFRRRIGALLNHYWTGGT